jgi:hypothetical protein
MLLTLVCGAPLLAEEGESSSLNVPFSVAGSEKTTFALGERAGTWIVSVEQDDDTTGDVDVRLLDSAGTAVKTKDGRGSVVKFSFQGNGGAYVLELWLYNSAGTAAGKLKLKSH